MGIVFPWFKMVGEMAASNVSVAPVIATHIAAAGGGREIGWYL